MINPNIDEHKKEIIFKAYEDILDLRKFPYLCTKVAVEQEYELVFDLLDVCYDIGLLNKYKEENIESKRPKYTDKKYQQGSDPMVEIQLQLHDLEKYCDKIELENHDLRCRNSTAEITLGQLYRQINNGEITSKQLEKEFKKFYELSYK